MNNQQNYTRPNFNAPKTNSFDDEFFNEFGGDENEESKTVNEQAKPAVAAAPKVEVKAEPKAEVKREVKPLTSADKNDDKWMTFPEGADYLGISHTTLRTMWRNDNLPVFKLSKKYLIKRSDFMNLVDSHMTRM